MAIVYRLPLLLFERHLYDISRLIMLFKLLSRSFSILPRTPSVNIPCIVQLNFNNIPVFVAHQIILRSSLVDVSIEKFITLLDEYIHWYSEKRIKLSLGGMSPLQYRRSLGLIETWSVADID